MKLLYNLFVLFCLSLSFFCSSQVRQNENSSEVRFDTIGYTTRNEPVIESRIYDQSGRKTGEWKRFVLTKSNKDSLILITNWKKDRMSHIRKFDHKNGYSDSYFDRSERLKKRDKYIDGKIYSKTTYRHLFRHSESSIYYHSNGEKKEKKKWKEFTVPDGELVRVKSFLKHGVWIKYDEDGKTIKRTKYRKQKPVS